MAEVLVVDAGKRVDIERRLYGQELMFFAITDGRTVLPLETAMDYKAAFDYDATDDYTRYMRMKYFGANNPRTGGIGGYSPHTWLDEELKQKYMKRIVSPTITKFRELKGIEYKGIIYFGSMVCNENGERNPYVLEINVRMGDPEAQVILPRLKTDFFDISEAIVEGRLHEINLEWDPAYCVGVCAVSGKMMRGIPTEKELALEWLHGGSTRDEAYDERKNVGYPGPHITSQPISGLEDVDTSCLVFHNGTVFDRYKRDGKGNQVVMTTGGRVLTLVARGETLEEARMKAYEEIRKIHFSNIRYRRGIGKT